MEVLKDKISKVPAKGSSSLSCPAFNSVIFWHHTTSWCQIFAYFHSKGEANRKLKSPTSGLDTQLSSAGSGVCEMTNQSTLGIQEEVS